MVRALLSAAALLLLAGAALAQAPRFELPIACEVGTTCFIQNHVDQDPGPGRQDYACGRLTYDGHDGTDFRLPDYRMMEAGVPVLAAADGTVLRVRDGMDDVNVNIVGRDRIMDVGGGNAVVIDHGGGWQTAYLHMKRGSVAVKPGDRVAAGQRLGLVGLSGLTEFPHLHFGVRHGGKPVDPFVGDMPATACGQRFAPLWSDAAAKQLSYRATAALGAGFSTRVPEAEAARRGEFGEERLPRDATLLVLWSDIMGARGGDRQRVLIEAPGGKVVFDNTVTVPGDKAAWFSYQGMKRPATGWPAGPYRGTVTLTRDGETVARLERTLATDFR
ncbi:M23 family metallopeptidase [Azospirillum thermophilum]|uniref:M23 family peptidase n=1 Tax=Azospirillum thermophilum TaxID=2202148 RepID=A0A2S2CZY6_9PROT|nr:M23 family metallopeptidase [Azospirillum thermophilum]AWK90062.1 M23 family peptidase [Azospirillum thermophilum]